AEPDADDVARLPCLTTRWPVAEMIMAAVDEMFAVFARSPPVPTMSTESARPGRGTAWSIMADTRPAISYGLTLRVVGDEKCGHCHIGGLAGHDLIHRPRRLFLVKVLLVHERHQQVRPVLRDRLDRTGGRGRFRCRDGRGRGIGHPSELSLGIAAAP